MAEVPAMGRVTVVLDIATLGGVRQPVPEAHIGHDLLLGDGLGGHAVGGGGVEGGAGALGGPRGRHERVRLAAHDARNRGLGVEARRDGAAGGLDGGDGGRGRPGHHDVDGLFEHGGGGGSCSVSGSGSVGVGVGGRRGGVDAAAEQLHALFGLVDAAGLGELADGDGAGRVDAALVDPRLDAVEVDGGEVKGEAILVETQLACPFNLVRWLRDEHTHC